MTDAARKFGFYTRFAESINGKCAQTCRLFLLT